MEIILHEIEYTLCYKGTAICSKVEANCATGDKMPLELTGDRQAVRHTIRQFRTQEGGAANKVMMNARSKAHIMQ